MSYLSFEMSNTVVEQLYKTLSKTIFRVGKRNRSGSFLIESYEEPPVNPQLQWDCKAVIKDCQESGHILLDGFVGRTGNDLSWLVMGVQSDTNYIAMESPTKVSAAWEQVYRQLNDIERLVIMVYGDEGERGGNREVSSESTRRETVFKSLGGDRGSNSGNGSRVSHRNDSMASFGSNTMNSRFENQQRNMLLSNIDKLFSDRVEIFIRCQDLTRTGVMFGIIKILLKAWAESVRLRTFGRGGFQQVQVDAEFAKVWLWRFSTADERLMYSLLEETQQTAYRRCIDPVPMDLKVSHFVCLAGFCSLSPKQLTQTPSKPHLHFCFDMELWNIACRDDHWDGASSRLVAHRHKKKTHPCILSEWPLMLVTLSLPRGSLLRSLCNKERRRSAVYIAPMTAEDMPKGLDL